MARHPHIVTGRIGWKKAATILLVRERRLERERRPVTEKRKRCMVGLKTSEF